MRKLIASINITLDGFCDHTAGIADEELHQFFTDLIKNSGVLLYGRTTYQLMESYWPTVVKNPTGNKANDEFAVAIDSVPKILFSKTIKNVSWNNSSVAQRNLKDEVLELKKQPGKDILAGSPSLIDQLTKLKLVDEFILCVHPVIIGKGLPLFKSTTERNVLKLLKTKTFRSGVMAQYFETDT